MGDESTDGILRSVEMGHWARVLHSVSGIPLKYVVFFLEKPRWNLTLAPSSSVRVGAMLALA